MNTMKLEPRNGNDGWLTEETACGGRRMREFKVFAFLGLVAMLVAANPIRAHAAATLTLYDGVNPLITVVDNGPATVASQARHALPPRRRTAPSRRAPFSATAAKRSNTSCAPFPSPNGIVRAPTPPGSLGISPATSANLPPANSPPNACKLYIEVHQCPSPRS